VDTFDRYIAAVTKLCSSEHVKTSSASPDEEKYPDSEFAVVFQEGTRVLRLFPLSCDEEVRESAEKISKLREALPPSALNMASERVTKAASVAGIDVPSSLRGRVWDGGDRVWWDEGEDTFWDALVEGAEKRASAREKSSAPKFDALASFQFKGRTVELAKVSELEGAISLLSHAEATSTEKRSMAKAIVAGYEQLGGFSRAGALRKTSAEVRKWVGERPRPEAWWHLQDRADDVRNRMTQVLEPGAIEKCASAYEALGAELKKEGVDYELVAEQVDKLDRAVGYKGSAAHVVMFLGTDERDRLAKASEGFEWVFGSQTLREEDIEKLPNLNLEPMKLLFGDDIAEKLRTSPLKTFRGLSDTQQRAVANFLEENVQVHSFADAIPHFG